MRETKKNESKISAFLRWIIIILYDFFLDPSSGRESKIEKTASSDLEGATGYTPPPDEPIPEWVNERLEDQEESNELHEIRRRRVERFSSTNLQALDSDDKKEKEQEQSLWEYQSSCI